MAGPVQAQEQSPPFLVNSGADRVPPERSSDCPFTSRKLAAELCIDPKSLFRSQSATGLDDLDKPDCTMKSEQQVIDASIKPFIDFTGATQRDYDKGLCAGLGGPPCVNPFPYRSISEFKRANPSCCRVLTVLPGDSGTEFRPNLRGERHPRMFYVAQDIQAFSKGADGQARPYRHRTHKIVDCYGRLQ